MNKREIARYIEYTKLEPTVTKEDIAKLCEDATKLGVYAICVNPKYVEFAKESLSDCSSKVKVVSVVGYPLGENAQEIKAMEAVLLKESGADEINVMLSTSAIITGNYDYVLEELKRIVDCTGIITKAIIDTSLLTEEQIIRTCEVCIEAGVKFIQTGTGHYAVIPETVKLYWQAHEINLARYLANVCF